MVSSTASSLIVLFMVISILKGVSPAGESDMRLWRAILFAMQTAILTSVACQRYVRPWRTWLKVRSINPHAAQFAAYRAAGISLATRQISQIREDLYRFSLSALSDKLNFPRGRGLQKV